MFGDNVPVFSFLWSEFLVLEKSSEWKKIAKLAGWSPMDLPAKWHFPEYKFDMKQVCQENV